MLARRLGCEGGQESPKSLYLDNAVHLDCIVDMSGHHIGVLKEESLTAVIPRSSDQGNMGRLSRT